jgi:hypothetical protein
VGFDPGDYGNYADAISYDAPLRIVYTGGYYGEKELWRLFLTALSDMTEKGVNIRFDYYGDWVSEQEEIRRQLPAASAKWLFMHGRVPKATCVDVSQQGHALLYLLEPNEENCGRISSKLYDYFASKRPILALTPQGSLASGKIARFCPDFTLELPDNWCNDRRLYFDKFIKLLEKLCASFEKRTLEKSVKPDIAEYSCEKGEEIFCRAVKGQL